MSFFQRLKDALEIPSCLRVEPERKRRKVRPELPSVSTTHVSTEEVDPRVEHMQETEAMEVRETEEECQALLKVPRNVPVAVFFKARRGN